jgi:hypothetical protein
MAATVKFFPMKDHACKDRLGMSGPSLTRTQELVWPWRPSENGRATDIFYDKARFDVAESDTDAIKLQKRFRFAALLLHELAHAAHSLLDDMCCEPFYGIELVRQRYKPRPGILEAVSLGSAL